MNRTATTQYVKPSQKGLSGSAKVVITDHIRRQMAAKGISGKQVIAALRAPAKVTRVMSRPEFIERGQLRYCGAGVAVVIEPSREGYVLKTVYLDGVRTALRADQMHDEYALTSGRATRERRGGLVYSC